MALDHRLTDIHDWVRHVLAREPHRLICPDPARELLPDDREARRLRLDSVLIDCTDAAIPYHQDWMVDPTDR